MPNTSLHAFKTKDTRFVAEWLKSKGLHKLFSVFEGIQEPFILSLACQGVVFNHVYIHSFRNIIKATEKFPGGGGIWTAFRLREGGIWTKILQKIQMPGGCPGGGMLKLRFDWYITSARLLDEFSKNPVKTTPKCKKPTKSKDLLRSKTSTTGVKFYLVNSFPGKWSFSK